MAERPFAHTDPFLQIIVLFLLSFVGVTLFLLMANGLISLLWGVNYFENPAVIQDYSNPQIVNVNRVLLMFQHLGLFIVPAIVFAAIASTRWKPFLNFYPLKAKYAIASILVMVAALPLINALSWLNQMVHFPEFLSGLEAVFVGMEESAAEITQAITGTGDPAILILNLVVVAVLPALGEEMIFRGLLLPILQKWTGKAHLAVWLSAFLFSAMHMQFFGFLPRMLLGALLGYLMIWSKSLWAPILAHLTNNALAVILLFFMARGSIEKEVDEFNPQGSDLVWTGISIIAVAAIVWWFIHSAKRDQIQSSSQGSASEIRRG